MNATELNDLIALVNATLSTLPSNTTVPPDFNITAAVKWLGLVNGTNVTLPATMSNMTVSELLNATAQKVAPTILPTLAPMLNSTNATGPSKADMAKLAARKAMMEYLRSRFYTLQLFLLAGYGIMFLLCVLLILYLRFNRNVAFRGDMNAARKVILPAFEPLLIVLACATGTYVIFFCVALATGLYTYQISKLATEVFYSGRQFVFLSIVVFMLQSSVSGPALRRSVLLTFLLATYTIPIVWYMTEFGDPDHFYTVLTVSRAFMLLLYTYIFIRPPGRASKRTIREFCVYAYIYYALLFTYNDLFRQTKLEPGFNLTYANLLWGSMCPLVIWRVLKADTEHWRGMGQRAVALQSLFRQKNNLPERISSKGLHVLIEMHRKYIIDFAYLELKQRIGVGASAVVFNGILRSKIPVAVKVYTPSDFNEDTVAGFSQEAALCGALHHPNIVKFYGMCVCPPTICLVSELCQGSLEDVTCAMTRRHHHENRQQMLLNIAYMLDAARAVAYIHSFTPAFLHRDIKPANFLVDAENNVKLTDFGESRSLPRTQITLNKTSLASSSSNATTQSQFGFKALGLILTDGTYRESVSLSSGANLQHVSHGGARKSELQHPNEMSTGIRLTIKGTVDYMAPEIINGKGGLASYGEAADVYALGITMWDILYPGQEKFPTAKGNHMLVFQCVTAGERPPLDDSLHASLRMIMESAWQSDPRLRPSAENVVSVLETVQEELAAELAVRLTETIGSMEHGWIKYGTSMEHIFTGDTAVDAMEDQRYVASVGEAIRVGNALMDASVLHHVKHSRPFEATDESYYFEEGTIALCRPIKPQATHPSASQGSAKTTAKLGASSGSSGSASRSRSGLRSVNGGSQAGSSSFFAIDSAASPRGSTTTKVPSDPTEMLSGNRMCPCRKLSQRLELPKISKRRRFQRDRTQPQMQFQPQQHVLSELEATASSMTGLGDLGAHSPAALHVKLLPQDAREAAEWDDFADFVDHLPRATDQSETIRVSVNP